MEQLNLMGQGRWQHGGEGIKGAVKDATERQFSTKSRRGAVGAGLVFSLAMSSRTSLRSVFSSWSALLALLSLGALGGALSGCSSPTAYVIEGDTMVYTLTNLHLGWHALLDGRATLWLDVYNLFDKRYSAAHGSASRTFFDMPQQPRSWMATLEYTF